MSFFLTKGVLQQQANRAGGGVPTDGLISYWKLDETSGPVVDSWGDNDGTNEGALRGVDGKVGNAFEFDGDDYVNVSSLNGVDIAGDNGDVSIAVWAITYQTDRGDVVARYGDISKRGFTIFFLNGNKVRIAVGNSDGNNSFSVSINRDEWYLVGFTHIGETDNNIVYVNGEKKGEFTQVFNTKTTENLTIGCFEEDRNDRFLEGKADELGIWRKALTSEEWVQLYNNGKGTTL